MQKWQCHKVVEAGKITQVSVPTENLLRWLRVEGETNPVVPARDIVEWFQRHQPEVGGYYVRYADGYESYSPAAAFEQGYTLLETMASGEVANEPMLQFFEYAHLPEHLQKVSRWFGEVARAICSLPRNPERTAALRKLLESKDCAVRARLYKEVPK